MEINCKSCGKDQPLIHNYQYIIDHEDEHLKQGIETGTLDSQACSFCNTKNNHLILQQNSGQKVRPLFFDFGF